MQRKGNMLEEIMARYVYVYIALKVNSARLFPSSHELNSLLAGMKKTTRTTPARRRSLLHTEKVLRRLV